MVISGSDLLEVPWRPYVWPYVWPYECDIPWNLGLKNRPYIYSRYLQFRFLNGHWINGPFRNRFIGGTYHIFLADFPGLNFREYPHWTNGESKNMKHFLWGTPSTSTWKSHPITSGSFSLEPTRTNCRVQLVRAGHCLSHKHMVLSEFPSGKWTCWPWK
jgi:hypothetical protein